MIASPEIARSSAPRSPRPGTSRGRQCYTIEISLAHNVGTEVERAYRRTDMIAKRRQLLEQWAKFCASPPAKSTDKVVVPLRSAQ